MKYYHNSIGRTIKVFISIAIFFFVWSNNVNAQSSYDNYTWQYHKPTSIQGADDLKELLRKEIEKITDNGHLAPFRTMYGEAIVHYSWIRTYDTIYTLSLAYPYLPPNTQTQVKSYILSELQNYPVWYSNPNNWNAPILDPNTGYYREPEPVSVDYRNAEYDSKRWTYRAYPKLFGLYVLWLYSQNTNDWQYVNSNWNSISSFYANNQSETSQYYSSIAGALGYARMVYKRNPTDSSLGTINNTITAGFTAGKDFDLFGLNAENIFKDALNLPYAISHDAHYFGYHFLDISPEIGRYLYDDPTLKNAVLGGTTFSKYSIKKGETKFPTWYMAQAPYGNQAYGEDSGLTPETRAMIFPVKSWVAKEQTDKLRIFLDAPDALIGDYYYIQNLVRTIEAHGTECWENITTTQVECPNTLPSTTQSPSSSPTPTPKPGDCEPDGGDSDIDIFDYNRIVSNFGSSTNLSCDFVNFGTIDIFDYNVVVSNFGI